MLQDLVNQREELKKQLIDVEKQIARHPDSIRSYFPSCANWDDIGVKALAAKVTFLKKTANGFIYEIDDKAYRIYTEEIYIFCGLIGKEEELDNNLLDDLHDVEVNDPVEFLENRGINDDWAKVAYLIAEY